MPRFLPRPVAGLARLLLCALLLPAAVLSGRASGQAADGGRMSIDRVVAVVNGDLIMESDVDEDRRFVSFQPYRDVNATSTDDQLVERLIDRRLILQQDALQPETPITDAAVDADLSGLRKNIPACAKYHCETDAGWTKFVEDQGFTLDELRDRWRQRMEVLRFIEARFRMGIRISQADIDSYYKDTLIPGFKKQNAAPPAEDTINDRIQEILLQQQVSKLLDDWLKALRAQGSVRIVKQGEAIP